MHWINEGIKLTRTIVIFLNITVLKIDVMISTVSGENNYKNKF